MTAQNPKGKDDDVMAILRLVKTVCFSIALDRFAVVLEPFELAGMQAHVGDAPHGWVAKLLVYSSPDHSGTPTMMARYASEYNPQHPDWEWGAEKALSGLRMKIEQGLKKL